MNHPTVPTAPWSPLGIALADYQGGRRDGVLLVHHEFGEPDELPAGHFFREWEGMPALEREALDRASGRALDLGAGAGSHALELQRRGADVVAADLLPQAVQVMRARGLRQVRTLDWRTDPLTPAGEPPWDTVLLLMNGPGIAGSLGRFVDLLGLLARSLADGGQILLDSTDIDQQGSAVEWSEEGIPLGEDGRYPGELHLQMEYDGRMNEPFPHLFVNPKTLQRLAGSAGLHSSTMLARESDDRYLARLSP